MPHDGVNIETIKELQIWLQGRFDLIAEVQRNDTAEMRKLRETVHDSSNKLSALLALNIPEKLTKLEAADAKHNAAIEQFAKDSVARKATIATLRAVYLVVGAALGTGITLFVELSKVIFR